MFYLKGNFPRGFRFMQPYPWRQPFVSQGLAGKPHLGDDDLTPVGTPLYAPFTGSVRAEWGPQGGHQAHFYRDGRRELFRFLHLGARPGEGPVLEGEQFGVTGNSGAATNSPHVHLDISRNGILNLNDPNNFLDPSTYEWNPQMAPITLRVKIIANNAPWPTLQAKLYAAAEWYRTNSGNRVNLSFSVEHTQFSSVPFQSYDGSLTGWGVEKSWQVENVIPRAAGFDIVAFHMPNSEWGNSNNTQGIMLGDQHPMQKTMVIDMHADEQEGAGLVMFGSHFAYLLCHEISHAMLAMTGQDWIGGENVTHRRFYTPDFADAPKIFSDINYMTLIAVLKARRKEQMLIIHKQSDPGTKYALSSDSKIGFADFPAYQRFTEGREVVDVEIPDAEFAKVPTSKAVIKT